MSSLKKIILIAATTMVAAGVFAESVTLNWGSGSTRTITLNDSQIPAEVLSLIKKNKSIIESALANNGVTNTTDPSHPSQLQLGYSGHNYDLTQINRAYGKLRSDYGFDTDRPITTATNGLNGFCDDLCDTLPNSQTQQNVWADAWIGKLLPFPHLGFGINAGLSEMNIKALKDAASALSIDVKDLKDSYVLPTITADVRLGGLVFPFDIGLTAMSIDTSKISSLESSLDPVAFDFFTLGMDLRYAIMQGGGIRPKVSVGGGFYYTDGSVKVDDDDASASLNFNSTTIFASAQASVKLICLVPFAGARVLFSKSKVDWDVKANWGKIFEEETDIGRLASWGIMPSRFSGSGESGFFEDIKPQVFGGVGIDILVLNITASLSYDVAAQLPSGALSIRLAL